MVKLALSCLCIGLTKSLNEFIILPIINVVGKGEGIDLEELANRLGIPRKNIIILANESTKLKLTEELDAFISFLQSLEILFEMED